MFEREAARSAEGSAVPRLARSVTQTAGKPYRTIAAGVKGVRRYGDAISAKHGVSKPRQFLRLLIDYWLSETPAVQFYLNQFYFPEPNSERRRHVTYRQFVAAQRFLAKRSAAPDLALLNCKDKFAAACKEKNLQTVPIVAEFVDGQPTNCEIPSTDLFAKPAIENLCGWNSQSLRYDPSSARFSCKEWRFLSGMYAPKLVTTQGLSKQDVVAMLCKQSQRGKIILQQKLHNHSDMAPITNGSLATIRIVTCHTPSGDIDMLPPAIRMPAGAAIVDNFDSGGIAAPIDLNSGAIIGPGVQRDPETAVRSVAAHPDTGFPLTGFTVPRWPDVVDLALRAHLSFPTLPSAGWDVAVLDDGPVLLEGNPTWGADVIALSHAINISDTPFLEYFNHYVASLKTNEGARL